MGCLRGVRSVAPVGRLLPPVLEDLRAGPLLGLRRLEGTKPGLEGVLLGGRAGAMGGDGDERLVRWKFLGGLPLDAVKFIGDRVPLVRMCGIVKPATQVVKGVDAAMGRDPERLHWSWSLVPGSAGTVVLLVTPRDCSRFQALLIHRSQNFRQLWSVLWPVSWKR